MMAPCLLGCVALLATGCPDGQSRAIPPGPTAAPGDAANTFIYVAATNSGDENAGSVDKYQLGEDGLLPGGPPQESFPVANPRRMIKHPTLDLLYVLAPNQIFAFDISGGQLRLNCPPGSGVGPPCATAPDQSSNPVDMAIGLSFNDDYVLYVVDQGGTDFNTLTRISAYSLGPAGELPFYRTSFARNPFAIFYQGIALTDEFAFAADAARSGFDRFTLQPDGNLPEPFPTPSNPGDPTPTALPSNVPTQTPAPSPPFFPAGNAAPTRLTLQDIPASGTTAASTIIYAVETSRLRTGTYPVLEPDANIDDAATSESLTRGIYRELLIDPNRQRIYGAGFFIGQIDSFALNADGTINRDTLSTSFANTDSYPTGMAYFEFVAPGSSTPQKTLFVSLGGFQRVDAYALAEDGTIADRPFSSTMPQPGTFPMDVVVFTAPAP